MSNAIPTKKSKHALGLPAGSVRAIHVLAIVGLVCGMILSATPTHVVAIPPYLIYLLLLMLGHYFGAHGVTIKPLDESEAESPLYLPGVVVRLFIMAALIGCIG